LNEPQVNQDNEAILSSQLYQDDFYPSLYGFQNLLDEDPPFLKDFESYTGKHLERIPGEVGFTDLLNKNLVTGLKEGSNADAYVGYFNDTAQHSIPILINAMSNAYAMLYNIGNISVSTQPFRLTEIPVSFDGGAFGGNLLIGITYVFIPCGFALELIYDRQIRAKNQLRVNGLTFPLYFGSLFLVLGVMLFGLLCILLALVAAFDFKALMIPAAFGILASMYFLYILPGLL